MKRAITVVIPALDEERELSECLESLVNQSFRDFEVIVVDNGSIDATVRIARSYDCSGDPRTQTEDLLCEGGRLSSNTGGDHRLHRRRYGRLTGLGEEDSPRV